MQFAQHKNKPVNYRRAKRLRSAATPIEMLLRKNARIQAKLFGIEFRFQFPIGPYVVDFICLQARLIVEIDGMSHDSQAVADKVRQEYLEQQGFRILRFSNSDVAKDVVTVAVTMCVQANEIIQSRLTHPRIRKGEFDPSAREG